MEKLKNNIPNGFDAPMDLPQSDVEAADWQEANRNFWETHPMRYDWNEGLGYKEFSREFFSEIDRRFFSNAAEYIPMKREPFDAFVDFDSLRTKDVLEIGVGNGSHAGIFARYSKTYTGIDITQYAVESTKRRMEVFGLRGTLRTMDAEKLDFSDASFDFVWAWGVIHHSSNTRYVLEEIARVLRPGGRAIIMVYYRGWWNYYVLGILRGLVFGDLFKTWSLAKTVQLYTDGAIARYYSASGWKEVARDLFSVEKSQVYGPKSDVVPLPGGRLKQFIARLLPNMVSRFMTHRLKMGCFLVSEIKKIS